jgi:hypothetical protein
MPELPELSVTASDPLRPSCAFILKAFLVLFYFRRRLTEQNIDSDIAAQEIIKRQAQRTQKNSTIEIKVYHGDYGKKGGNIAGALEGFLSKNSITIPEKSLKGNTNSDGTRSATLPKLSTVPIHKWKAEKGSN